MNASRLNLTLLLVVCLTASGLQAAELTSDQRAQLLKEATASYEQGLQSSGDDVAAAKDAFARAADRYRLLIDSGIENPQLYENLGNAQLQSGRLGEAVAAYEHAAVLAPSDPSIRRHLDQARALVADESTDGNSIGVMEYLAGWNRSVSIGARLSAGLIAWTLLWAGLLGWTMSGSTRWRRTAIGAGVAALLMAASIGWDWSQQPHGELGIITDATTVRTHNGDTFPALIEEPLVEGTRVDVVDHRGDWLHVRLSNGIDGWIPQAAADVIGPAGLFRSSRATADDNSVCRLR